jgi:hypothetical protein
MWLCQQTPAVYLSNKGRLQVGVVDHDSGEELVKVNAKAAEAIGLHCDEGPVACIQV